MYKCYVVLKILINGDLKWELFWTSQPKRWGFLRVAHVCAHQSVVEPPKHFVFEEIRSPFKHHKEINQFK